MIVHLDADAFFASVEQAADVRLRGKPVAVGGSKRGVVASASYEARRLGIYTTMPTAKARKLCPSLITVSGDFEKYEKFSRLMFSYAYDHTPAVEVVSIDEGYFDLKGNCKRSAREVAEIIRTAIRQSLKISVSGDRPKQAGWRCDEQSLKAILLHRDPGRARARVSVSARKQMAAGSWASDGKNAQPGRSRSYRPNRRSLTPATLLIRRKGCPPALGVRPRH